MNTRDKKNIMIVAILIAITFMSAGYAMLSEQINVKDMMTSVNKVLDVKLISISSIETEGYAESLQESIENKFTAKFNTKFQMPKDKITYVINVKNEGNVAAKLKSIDITTEEDGKEFLSYTVNNLSVGDELKVGDTTMFTLTIEYNSELNITLEEPLLNEITLTLNY